MRSLGRVSGSSGKNKQEKVLAAALPYITKSRLLMEKLISGKRNLPLIDMSDLSKCYELDKYKQLLIKHIDLVERRIVKGESIPHTEKMMSIFEDYTEWIAKGKLRPSIEFGKKVSITTDQYNLIIHHKVMDNEQDKDVVVEIADAVLNKYGLINSMSFDKGYWRQENKALLQLAIPHVVIPKLGKRTTKEDEIETSYEFKSLKNKHSAIESNINELEHRGLDRCPDRGYDHYKSYIALGVCAYNLKKIGKKILENLLVEKIPKTA
jgi:hypothetical protein